MMRHCPACCSNSRELMYEYELTGGQLQKIYSCLPCGMVYASSIAKPVDYQHSIYEVPGAIGSGASEYDRNRLEGTAELIGRHIYGNVSVLDIGCGQGGLLDALRDCGFTKLTGLDPSSACCAEASRRGHLTHCGFLSELKGKFDLITLSHVLEHIEYPDIFLFDVLEHLCPYGRIYVEVPDASKYYEFCSTIPLLDFNSEHVNHFGSESLHLLLSRCGFQVVYSTNKEIVLTSGTPYPAISVVAERKRQALQLNGYIQASTELLALANKNLETALSATNEIAIWGAGEYLAHVLLLPAIASRQIICVADRNPALHGRSVAGNMVVSPSSLPFNVPVVIAAVVAGPAIKREADEMGLHTITLEFQ